MQIGQTKDLETVMVQNVTAAATPDGRIALVLHLKGQTIALEMNQQRIDAMRYQLGLIESFLSRPVGRA